MGKKPRRPPEPESAESPVKRLSGAPPSSAKLKSFHKANSAALKLKKKRFILQIPRTFNNFTHIAA